MRSFLQTMMGLTGLIAFFGAMSRRAEVAVPALIMCALWGLAYLVYDYHRPAKVLDDENS